MAKNEIAVKKSESILDEIDRLQQTIRQRAYDLFESGDGWRGAVENWLKAEGELIAKPAIELRQKDGVFEVLAALPGIDAKDLDVQITGNDLLIKGQTTSERKTDEGTVHTSEIKTGKVFRSIQFPEPIDPESARAEFKNGMLEVTVTIAKGPVAKKVAIQAA
jgi:HSP20 family protein